MTVTLDSARSSMGFMGGLALAAETVAVLALVINIVITFANAMSRFILHLDFPWSGDSWTILISVISFIGAPAYFRRGSGMAYTAVIDQMTGVRRELTQATGSALFLGVILTALCAYPAFFMAEIDQKLAIFNISVGFSAVWLGVGLVLFAVFTIEKLLTLSPCAVAFGFGVAALVTASTLIQRWAYQSGYLEMDPFILILPIAVLSFLTAVPIAGILALCGVLYFVATGDAPLVTIPSALQYGVHSFILLAIPFFMLAGTLMEVTGMAKRMIDMVQQWVGHWSGGLLIAQIIAMYIFSGVSGSKGADIATVGSVMKGPLRQYGYPPEESVAVLAASAAMGETIPPSLALLVLGSVTTLSVGSLFVAGVVPAAVLATALILAVLVRSRIKGFYKGPPFALKRALGTVPLAIPACLVPVIVVGGIIGGVASPTESASFAVVYGFFIALFLYHSLGRKNCWLALRDATLIAGMVLFMIAASNLLSQSIVTDGLGRLLTTAFESIESPRVLMFASALVMIVIGIVLEGLPAILIAAPILLPAATKLGIAPLQFGMILCIAMGIGVFMPLVGIGYYLACAIGEAPVNATSRPSLIYNCFLGIGLVLVILFPGLTLWLPHALGMR